MYLAHGVARRDAEPHGKSRGLQRAGDGVLRQLGRVVLLGKVREQDVARAALHGEPRKFRRRVVGQVPLVAEDAALEEIGVGAVLQRFHVVIGFEQECIHACEHFNLYWAGLPYRRALVEGLEEPVAGFMWWLLAGKMYTIFALLFGLSFYVQSDNQAQRGRSFTGRFTWRMALLLGIGLVNTAFYNGDVLVLYALLGVLLPWLGKLPTRWLWALFGILALQPLELFQIAAARPLYVDADVWGDAALPAFTEGTLGDTLRASLRYGQPMTLAWYLNNGRITQTLAMFLLGMLLGRRRLFYDEPGNRRVWGGILAGSLLAAVALAADFGGEGSPLRVMTSAWYNLAQTMALVASVVLLWYGFGAFRRAVGPISAIGRMSLTNYLLQSVLGTAVFYNWGLGLYREVGIVYALLIGTGLVVVQYQFSRLWLRRFSHGPVEWLWKKLTWL